MNRKPTYVLITPARNEEAYIELTIKSVISQTVLPLKWIIVSDGSTDNTDNIVKKYTSEHPWIELLQMPERKERHFAGKVHAFNAGYEKVKNIDFNIIGNLDADIAFDDNYFSFLLNKFADNPRLGVGGTPFQEEGKQYDFRFASLDHVSGACQLFRKECFEAIGGYTPLKMGGIDLNAVMTARMKGWQTRTFTEKTCDHLKKTQAGKHSNFKALIKSGYHDYLMGSHPLWQFLRSVRHIKSEPFLIGGASLFIGYMWAMATRPQRSVSSELMEFRKKEQMLKLKELCKKFFISKKIL
ncbi:glycosyltransferase [Desulfobacterium sp. N47]|uniref:Glycosyltransferase 2-like domain-containing protein n=1 Tax=uncultured Desulfobacterium sp. TaxID=201089 RepID=E1YJK3_9BACT|nr:hypothetical protein N47_E49690 [uncultured Desulfobacterium sp.]